MVTTSDAWVVGHRFSRVGWPELTWAEDNHQVEHRACSDASGQAAVQEKAARDALRAAGLDPNDYPPSATSLFSPRPAASATSARSRSLSPDPSAAMSVPERLTWDHERLQQTPWLEGLLDVPGDEAAVPLAMTAPHPNAVGSYGAQAVEFIERVEAKQLRWFQRLTLARVLEHDAAGALVWRVVVHSASRRSGKSVLVRGLALFRLAHADLFGERQEVVHTGSDLAVCRKAQKEAWRWAEAQAWTVTRGNGKEAIETPEGDAWLVRAQAATYGWDTTLALVDEAWDVSPDTVTEGLAPSLLERQSPQLFLTSTAHTRSSSLMRRRISDALATDDGSTLLLLWGAPDGADVGDPDVWRAASPHWSEDRARTLADAYAAALRGEADPEVDDLSPMQAFTSQMLNQWTLRAAPASPGDVVVSEDAWAELRADLGDLAPGGVAVEGWAAGGLSVAAAWREGDIVTVSAVDVPDVASAAELVKAYGCRRAAVVGTSLAADPAWRGMRVEARSGTPLAAVTDLAGLLRDGVLRHDGGELSSQVLALRTSTTPTGLRLRSAGRLDAVKAATWAVGAARKPSRGALRVLVART